jgi:hypothetical protein
MVNVPLRRMGPPFGASTQMRIAASSVRPRRYTKDDDRRARAQIAHRALADAGPAEVHLVGLRQFVVWAAALGGLATLCLHSSRCPWCSLPYILVQPTLRYRYMNLDPSDFLRARWRVPAHRPYRANVPGKAKRSARRNSSQ